MRSTHRLLVPGLLLICVAAMLTSCTPPDPWKFANKIDLTSPKGEPKIDRVQDLGSVPLILNKPLHKGTSDGVAVAGELLVIRGKNLGKLPQVNFGAKAMSVLARTEDGGIVVRAPAGTTPGKLNITVSHGRGSASYPMELRRYGLAIIPGLPGVQILNVGAKDVQVMPKPLIASAPGFVELDRYGTVAFVTTGGKAPRLLVIDLAAAGGPKEITQRKVGQWKVLGLSVASEAKMAAVLHEKAIVMFDLEDPRDPMRYNPARFPPGVLKAGVVDVQLSPDGKTLAVLVKQKNSVVLFDVSDPNQVRNTTFISLLPEAKEPLVRSMHFASEGGSNHQQVLWVATGDTPRSQLVGKHSPQLLKYQVISAVDKTVLPSLKKLTSLALPGRRTPATVRTSFAVAQAASASVIRREPSKMTIFVSMIHPDMFLLGKHRLTTPTGLQRGAELLRRLGKFGTILKLNHRAEGGPFHQEAALYTSLQITGDGKLLLAAGCKPEVTVDPPKVEIPCGLLVKPIEQSTFKLHTVGKLPLGAFAPPFKLGTVRVQP
jgi:IPT/TIG domain